MNPAILLVSSILFIASIAPAWAKGGSHEGRHHASHSSTATTVPRDSQGHIKRSAQAKHDFKKQHPCPSTGKSSGACPGYVVDHVVPLKRGGPDKPSNMQWQSKEAAKAKDKWE